MSNNDVSWLSLNQEINSLRSWWRWWRRFWRRGWGWFRGWGWWRWRFGGWRGFWSRSL